MTLSARITDAPLGPLKDRPITVIGFGNQGAAHACNLRDSGLAVTIGARHGGSGAAKARAAGFECLDIADAARLGDLVVIALPDEIQGDLWASTLGRAVRPGATVGFLHGFSVHYGHITAPPEVGIVLVAPKGPGATLRARYSQGAGIPCLLAVQQDPGLARERALAWAAGIGAARAAIVETTFRDETETDLFGEQSVLCGGMLGLIQAAFETLVEAGYSADLAYMECVQEIKQVADLLYERGLEGMMEAISNTAEFGAYRAAPRIADDHVRATMRALLEEIRSGTFAQSLTDDAKTGLQELRAARRTLADSDLERAGAAVRQWMPWLTKEEGK